MSELYDVIILGGGPAGLTAGLYAGRSRLKTLLIEKNQDGGQIALSADVENYPGQLLEGETGISLAARMASSFKERLIFIMLSSRRKRLISPAIIGTA